MVDEYGEFDVLPPTLVCNWDYFDCGFPLEMGVFTFAGKVYMVGGETTGGLHQDELSSNGKSCEKLVEPSDKVYEFPNPPNGTLHELSDTLRLPSPMRSPIVAKINGSIYALYGDHCYKKPAMPSDSSNCFVVLEKDDGRPIDQCRWRSLPTPPFYKEGTPDYYRCLHCYKLKLGVIGHKLYVSASGRRYAFDADTEKWESGVFGYPVDAETLTKVLKGGGRQLQNDCFLVVTAEIFSEFVSDMGAFVALVDCKTGSQLHKQRIPEAYDIRLPIAAYQVIELQEKDGDDKEHQLRNTFCFVYTTCTHLVGLTVLRFSLAASSTPALAVVAKTSKQKMATASAVGKAGGGIHLNVEVLEKRLYKSSEPGFYPVDFHAFFL